MLVLFRAILTVLFLGCLAMTARKASANLDDDVSNAGWFALSVIVGVAASMTWAPVLGRIVAGPVSGLMTDGTVTEDRTWLIRFARRCEARGWQFMARWAAFVEGVRHPNLPAAFVVGMNNSRPGSWLERAFAREVWKFNNIANCVRAHAILKERHGEIPPDHEQGEVNLALMAHVREPEPDPGVLAVPPAPEQPLPARNKSIRLFDGAAPPPGADDSGKGGG